MSAFINNYRIKLHNAEDNQNEFCVMASRIISYWKTDNDNTLIYVEGLDAPVMVKEPFEIVDGLILRAIGVRKKSIPTIGGVKVKTLKPNTSLDVATVLYHDTSADSVEAELHEPTSEPYSE